MSSDGTTRCGKGSDASSERACLFPSPMRCTNCVCDSFYMTTIILWLSPTIEPLPAFETRLIRQLRDCFGGCVRGAALVTGVVDGCDVVKISLARLHGLVLERRAVEKISIELRPRLRQVRIFRAIEVIARQIFLRVCGEEDGHARRRGGACCRDFAGGGGRENVKRIGRDGVRVQALDRLAARAEGDCAGDV